MARLVAFKDTEPKEITVGNTTIKICRCGLTRNKDGLCDQTHMIARDENPNATYFYDKDLNRELVDLIADDELEEDGCCGNHSCGCGHNHNANPHTHNGKAGNE